MSRNPNAHQGPPAPESNRPGPPDNLPNPTANTSLTNPGPAPQPQAGGQPPGARSKTGPGTHGAPPKENLGDTPGLIPEIPWDPTGKIDDEVERRTAPASSGAPQQPGGAHAPHPSTGVGGTPTPLGSPKGGGEHPTAEGTGPGRYGGASGTPLSTMRYADATDDAPTSPEAAATTTLASLAAGDEHTMRESTSGGPDAETWQGGAATQQVMQATEESSGPRAGAYPTKAPAAAESGATGHPHHRSPQHTGGQPYEGAQHGGGGFSEVH